MLYEILPDSNTGKKKMYYVSLQISAPYLQQVLNSQTAVNHFNMIKKKDRRSSYVSCDLSSDRATSLITALTYVKKGILNDDR